MGGFSKAKLVEHSWIVCWRHKKKNLLSLEVHCVVFGLYMPLGWDYGFLFNINLPNQRNTDQMSHSLFTVWIQSDVTDLKQSAGWVLLSPAPLWEGLWDASWLSNCFGNSLCKASLESVHIQCKMIQYYFRYRHLKSLITKFCGLMGWFRI